MNTLLNGLGNWTPGAVGIWGLVGIVLFALIRAWPALSQMRVDADQSLRADLMARIHALETKTIEDRKQCLIEQEQIHEQLRAARTKLDGVVRQFIAFQQSVAEAVPPEMRSPVIEAMMKSSAEWSRE